MRPIEFKAGKIKKDKYYVAYKLPNQYHFRVLPHEYTLVTAGELINRAILIAHNRIKPLDIRA